MIRTIILLLFFIIFFILTTPLLIIEWFIGKKDPKKARLRTAARVKWGLTVATKLAGIKLTVKGVENVPTDRGILFVGNHQSFFDIIATYSTLPVATGFVAKQSIAKVPFLSTYMRRIRCLFLNRENLKEGAKTILQAAEYVKDGTAIFIYPEGTRNKSKDETALLPFHGGSFKIAQKSKCPIVPVAITGTAEVFENHMPFVKAHAVTIEYGTPLSYAEMEPEVRKNVGEYYQNLIGEMVKKNHDEAENK
ncbi:MAG: 1-acyl-sn-glycerol-3-phosphate acyltransferase [Lachnospiraceae bacterium]|nr:1-acyl-sn-glycerol-3-phosphate acyltransferase [Candidatus Equihabitans merdae]